MPSADPRPPNRPIVDIMQRRPLHDKCQDDDWGTWADLGGFHDAEGRLARTGDVALVFSKRPPSAWKTMVAFATKETKLAGRAIVSIYEKRRAIEVLFKELQNDLGLGDD